MKSKQDLLDEISRLEREIAVFRDFYCKVITIGPTDFVVFSTPRMMTREQSKEIHNRLRRFLSFEEDDRRLIVLSAGCELFVMPDLLRERDDQIAGMWKTIRRLGNEPDTE